MSLILYMRLSGKIQLTIYVVLNIKFNEFMFNLNIDIIKGLKTLILVSRGTQNYKEHLMKFTN